MGVYERLKEEAEARRVQKIKDNGYSDNDPEPVSSISVEISKSIGWVDPDDDEADPWDDWKTWWKSSSTASSKPLTIADINKMTQKAYQPYVVAQVNGFFYAKELKPLVYSEDPVHGRFIDLSADYKKGNFLWEPIPK